jgi:hypothetical protein
MRRALALTLLAVGLQTSGTAAAGEPCVWRDADTTTKAGFETLNRFVRYERRFACPGKAKGAWRLEVVARAGATSKPVSTEKGKVEPRGRWLRETLVQEGLAVSQYCDLALPADAKPTLVLDEDGVRQAPGVPVEIVARFTGEGDLSGLTRTETTTTHCLACAPGRGWKMGLGVYDGRAMSSEIRPGLRLKAHAEAEWFQCARRDATLEVRWFTADDDRALGAAIRPAYVQTGLEKQFAVRGDEAAFDVAVPVDRICKHPGKRVAWEVAGTGLLARVGGGGRSYHALKCK